MKGGSLKLLHVSDLHFHKAHFDWVYQQRRKVDAVCITGDFLDREMGAAPVDEQIAWVSGWLGMFDMPIFICSGNHDVIEPDVNAMSLEDLFSGYDDPGDPDGMEAVTSNNIDWMKDIKNKLLAYDGQAKEFNGYLFGCAGYESFNFSRFSKCDVVLSHVPPAKTRLSRDQLGEDYGCHQLRAALEAGVISSGYVLSGHVHNPVATVAKLKSTQLVNPGSDNTKSIAPHRIIVI